MDKIAALPAGDKEHIRLLLQWSAQAHARGDHESGERLLNAAHKVLDLAHAEATA